MRGSGRLDGIDSNVNGAVLDDQYGPGQVPLPVALTVPFLNPTDMERAEVSSRWTCDSVVRAPIAPQELRSARYWGEMTSEDQRAIRTGANGEQMAATWDWKGQLTQELSGSRETNLGDVQQQFSGDLETSVDLVRAVHVGVWLSVTMDTRFE